MITGDNVSDEHAVGHYYAGIVRRVRKSMERDLAKELQVGHCKPWLHQKIAHLLGHGPPAGLGQSKSLIEGILQLTVTAPAVTVPKLLPAAEAEVCVVPVAQFNSRQYDQSVCASDRSVPVSTEPPRAVCLPTAATRAIKGNTPLLLQQGHSQNSRTNMGGGSDNTATKRKRLKGNSGPGGTAAAYPQLQLHAPAASVPLERQKSNNNKWQCTCQQQLPGAGGRARGRVHHSSTCPRSKTIWGAEMIPFAPAAGDLVFVEQRARPRRGLRRYELDGSRKGVWEDATEVPGLPAGPNIAGTSVYVSDETRRRGCRR
jgi:hypothetical protein